MIDLIAVEQFRRFLIDNSFKKHFYQLESSLSRDAIEEIVSLYAHVVVFHLFWSPLDKRPLYEVLVTKMKHHLKNEKVDKMVEVLLTNAQTTVQAETLIEDILYESLTILNERKQNVIFLCIKGSYKGINETEHAFLENSIMEVSNKFVFVLIPLCEDAKQLTSLNKRNNFFMETTNIRTNKVHFSYKHLDRYRPSLESILRGLSNAHIDVSIDLTELEVMDSIKKYEDEIGASDIVVVIISPEYLQSIQCMYEMTEILKNGNINNRIIPIVDLGYIPRTREGLRFIKEFWNEQNLQIRNRIATELGQIEYLTRELRIIGDIIYYLDNIWLYVTDYMTGGIEEMSANEGGYLIKCVRKLQERINKQRFNSISELKELSSNLQNSDMMAPSTSREVHQGDKSLYIEHNDGTIVIN